MPAFVNAHLGGGGLVQGDHWNFNLCFPQISQSLGCPDAVLFTSYVDPVVYKMYSQTFTTDINLSLADKHAITYKHWIFNLA